MVAIPHRGSPSVEAETERTKPQTGCGERLPTPGSIRHTENPISTGTDQFCAVVIQPWYHGVPVAATAPR